MKNKIYNIALVKNMTNDSYYIIDSKTDLEFFKSWGKKGFYTMVGKILTVYDNELETIRDMLYAIATNDDDIVRKKIGVIKIWIQYDYYLSHLSDVQKEDMINNYEKGYLNNEII